MYGIKLKDLTQALLLSYRISILILTGQRSLQKKVKRSFLHIQSDKSVSIKPFFNMTCVVSKSRFCILFTIFMQSNSDFYQMRQWWELKQSKRSYLQKFHFFISRFQSKRKRIQYTMFGIKLLFFPFISIVKQIMTMVKLWELWFSIIIQTHRF